MGCDVFLVCRQCHDVSLVSLSLEDASALSVGGEAVKDVAAYCRHEVESLALRRVLHVYFVIYLCLGCQGDEPQGN